VKKKSILFGGAIAGVAGVIALNASSACGCIPTEQERLSENLFAASQGGVRAAMLIKSGKAVAKHYAPGYSDTTRFISWSMAKSITAVLVGEMVADGKLDLDAPVPFAEWQEPGDPRQAITLRHMLTMSSGLDHTEDYALDDGGGTPKRSDTTSTLFVDGTGNMAVRGIAKGLEAKPGAKYEYSSITSLMLAELITRQLTDSKDPRTRAAAYKAFAEERLFKPAGITSAFMEFDGAGTQIGGSIIYMTLDDWGRFGQILLAGKGANGDQVIAPDWLTFMRTPSKTDPGYGGHVWLNRPRSGENAAHPALFPGHGPDTVFAAVGHLGQYVIVSPDQNLVLVRLGKTNDGHLASVREALGAIVAVPVRNQ
jgi:CubicO group peptidase (beta-lactamase class C family)